MILDKIQKEENCPVNKVLARVSPEKIECALDSDPCLFDRKRGQCPPVAYKVGGPDILCGLVSLGDFGQSPIYGGLAEKWFKADVLKASGG